MNKSASLLGVLKANSCCFTKIICFGFSNSFQKCDVYYLSSESICGKHYAIKNISQTKYSRLKQIKFVEDSLQKNWKHVFLKLN